jgi:hypothetical protein
LADDLPGLSAIPRPDASLDRRGVSGAPDNDALQSSLQKLAELNRPL